MANRTWWQGRAATLTWLVALVAGLLVAAAYPVAASAGSKTPAISVAPHHKVAGRGGPGGPGLAADLQVPGQHPADLLRPGPDPGRVRHRQGQRHRRRPHDRHRRRLPEPDDPARPRPVRPDLRAPRGDGEYRRAGRPDAVRPER